VIDASKGPVLIARIRAVESHQRSTALLYRANSVVLAGRFAVLDWTYVSCWGELEESILQSYVNSITPGYRHQLCRLMSISAR